MLRVNRLTIAQRMLSLVLFINLLASVAYAQESSSVRKGNYEIFYSAFNTSFLQPETAVAVGVSFGRGSQEEDPHPLIRGMGEWSPPHH